MPSLPAKMKILLNLGKNSSKTEKKTFLLSALFHMKNCLKYFLNVYLWNKFFASNSVQEP